MTTSVSWVASNTRVQARPTPIVNSYHVVSCMSGMRSQDPADYMVRHMKHGEHTDFSAEPSHLYRSRMNVMPPAAVSSVQPSSLESNLHPCNGSNSGTILRPWYEVTVVTIKTRHRHGSDRQMCGEGFLHIFQPEVGGQTRSVALPNRVGGTRTRKGRPRTKSGSRR